MKLKLFKFALPWLLVALVLPALALSLTAVPAEAGCGCGTGGTPVYNWALHIDVSPAGTGDIAVSGQVPPFYPYTRTLVPDVDVALEAIPADGYYFVGWGGDLSGSANPTYVRMDSNVTVTALFFPEELFSTDARLHLILPMGTVVRDSGGELLAGLDINVDETPLPPPGEGSLIGLPYVLGPDGTSFDQLVSLSCRYDPAQIPDRVDEEGLYLAYLDFDSGEWWPLPSVVDIVHHVVTAQVDHLSVFSVIAPEPPPLPAVFTPSQLTISPLEIEVGQAVTVSVLVTNSGEAEGSYSVVLKVNGVAMETREVTMAGGSQTVSFSTTGAEGGSYSVEVNGLEGSFTVLKPQWPMELPGVVGWVILALALVVLGLAVGIYQIVKARRNYY